MSVEFLIVELSIKDALMRDVSAVPFQIVLSAIVDELMRDLLILERAIEELSVLETFRVDEMAVVLKMVLLNMMLELIFDAVIVDMDAIVLLSMTELFAMLSPVTVVLMRVLYSTTETLRLERVAFAPVKVELEIALLLMGDWKIEALEIKERSNNEPFAVVSRMVELTAFERLRRERFTCASKSELFSMEVLKRLLLFILDAATVLFSMVLLVMMD